MMGLPIKYFSTCGNAPRGPYILIAAKENGDGKCAVDDAYIQHPTISQRSKKVYEGSKLATMTPKKSDWSSTKAKMYKEDHKLRGEKTW